MPEHAAPQQPQQYSEDAEAEKAEVAEADYLAFCALMRETARGRALLDEYVRRHRATDTETLLAALARIEQIVSGMTPPQAEAATAPEATPAQPELPNELNSGPQRQVDPPPETIAQIMAQVMALSEAERIALFT